MIKNTLLKETYENLLNNHTVNEANFIMLNSLSILGDKKVIVSEEINEEGYARINKYKYPDRLASFVRTCSEKTEQWAQFSFAKIAFS